MTAPETATFEVTIELNEVGGSSVKATERVTLQYPTNPMILSSVKTAISKAEKEIIKRVEGALPRRPTDN